MDIRKGNIFALLEDDEPEDVPVSKPKPAKPAPQAAAPKTEAKPQKAAEPVKKPTKDSAKPAAASEPIKTQNKEVRNQKREDKPVRDDRHSRTGRDRGMKKNGGGGHNWGTPGQEVKVDPESAWTTDEKKEADEKNVDAPAGDEKQEEKVEEKAEEKKPDFITFSDFLKPKEKEEEKENEEDDGKQKSVLGFKIAAENRGRGKGRGQEDRRKIEIKESRTAPNTLDAKAFPSLA
jgi:hypothetical protein